jgi:hypothetical protein
MTFKKPDFYSDRNEYRKDRTPSTGALVWVVPAFLMLVLLSKVDAVAEPRSTLLLDPQDSEFVCVMGVCL